MPSIHATHRAAPTKKLGEAFLRDLNSLLITSRSLTRSLLALEPQRGFSPETIAQINELVAIARDGEDELFQYLGEAGLVLPSPGEIPVPPKHLARSRLVEPVTATDKPADVLVNLRLLVHHLELRARLVAEEARLVGQRSLRRALLAWATEWYAYGRNLLSLGETGILNAVPAH